MVFSGFWVAACSFFHMFPHHRLAREVKQFLTALSFLLLAFGSSISILCRNCPIDGGNFNDFPNAVISLFAITVGLYQAAAPLQANRSPGACRRCLRGQLGTGRVPGVARWPNSANVVRFWPAFDQIWPASVDIWPESGHPEQLGGKGSASFGRIWPGASGPTGRSLRGSPKPSGAGRAEGALRRLCPEGRAATGGVGPWDPRPTSCRSPWLFCAAGVGCFEHRSVNATAHSTTPATRLDLAADRTGSGSFSPGRPRRKRPPFARADAHLRGWRPYRARARTTPTQGACR